MPVRLAETQCEVRPAAERTTTSSAEATESPQNFGHNWQASDLTSSRGDRQPFMRSGHWNGHSPQASRLHGEGGISCNGVTAMRSRHFSVGVPGDVDIDDFAPLISTVGRDGGRRPVRVRLFGGLLGRGPPQKVVAVLDQAIR
jgi:hypothetical protein